MSQPSLTNQEQIGSGPVAMELSPSDSGEEELEIIARSSSSLDVPPRSSLPVQTERSSQAYPSHQILGTLDIPASSSSSRSRIRTRIGAGGQRIAQGNDSEDEDTLGILSAGGSSEGSRQPKIIHENFSTKFPDDFGTDSD